MCPGFNGDSQAMDDLRKTTVINRELHRLCVDVAALQETRLADDGTLREQNFTFFWQGKKAEELRIHGVGFAVKNSLLSTLEPPTGGSEQLLNLKMFPRTGVVNLVCAYAPTMCSTADEKDQFYDALDSTVVAQRLQEALRTSLGRGRGDATTAGAKWEQVRTALYQSGLETLGKKEHCNVG